MSVLKKTLLVIVGMVVVSTISVYLASQLTLLQGYEKIEQDDARAHIVRTVNSFYDQSRTIIPIARAYAVWDDMYQFVETPDPAFLDSLGLTSDLYATHQVNLIAILDINGNPLFLKMYDLETSEPLPIPSDLEALLQPGSLLLGHTRQTVEKTGVVLLNGRPMYVASLGSLHTDFTGEPHGALIFGRFLDAQVIQNLTNAMQLPVTAYLLDDPAMPADVQEANAALQASSDAQPLFVKSLDRDFIASYAYMMTMANDPAFILKVLLPRRIYAQGLTSFRYFAILAATAGLGFIAISMLLLHRFVLSPLTTLTRQISAIRTSGDNTQRLHVQGQDELAQLGLMVNAMLEALERQSVQYLQATLDSVNDAIFVHDASGHILDVNATACRMFGYSREELLHLEVATLSANITPYTQAEAVAWLDKAREEGPQLFEWRSKTRAGDVFWSEVNASYAQAGKDTRFFVTVRNIAERKEAEIERERLIYELEKHNAELERFIYTVSHDLKSPLITIGGFVGFLEKDAQVGDAERVQADMIHINTAIDKMQRLLDELLELSRIGRIINPPEEVAFADIAQEAVALLHQRIEARGAEVEIAPNLPAVYGDRTRLVEVVQNLLDNACKFMGEQPHPRIEIGARQDQGEVVFYVRDNGMGIDPQYHDKVFSLFEKLNPQSEGTGVGLALVKRIVETHGGKIWVESEFGQGATFFFTL